MKMERIFSLIIEKDRKLPLYVTGLGYEEHQDHIIRRGGFPNYHLAICDNGTGRLLIDGKEYIIDKGMAFFFYPNIPHEYYTVKEPWSIRWIIFDGFGVDALLSAVNLGQYDVFTINNPEEINYCYNRLYKTLSAKKSNNMLEASGIFYNFLTNISYHIQTDNTGNITKIDEKLNRVIDYIKGNFEKDISLEDMAVLAEVSPSYLCRIFKKVYGITPITYVIRYRINIAKEWIINSPDKSIKNIAFESGFTDCSYFGATFREYEGCSPNQLRMLYKRNG